MINFVAKIKPELSKIFQYYPTKSYQFKTDSISYIFSEEKLSNKDKEFNSLFLQNRVFAKPQQSLLLNNQNTEEQLSNLFLFSQNPENTYSGNLFFYQKLEDNKIEEQKVKITTEEKQKIKPSVKTQNISFSSYWVFAILFLSFTLIAIVKNLFKDYIKNQFLSVLSYSYSVTEYRESYTKQNRPRVLLNFIFYLIVGVFITQTIHYYGLTSDKYSNILLSLFFSTVILIISSLQRLLNYLLGFIFMKIETSAEYNNSIHIYNHVLGLLLIPIITGIAFISPNYTKIFINIGIITFAILYISKLYRLLKINMANGINLFYFIIYICTLEIMLVFTLFKLSILMIVSML